MRRVGALLAIGLAMVGCQAPSGDPDGRSPYAALSEREIAALGPAEVRDLLAGRGAGYALAAELNHYPGPLHVLDLTAALELTDEQRRAIQQIRRTMLARARDLGHRLVELERDLDEAFASGAVTAAETSALAAEIGSVEGLLRATHLRAHIRVRDVLTPEQVERYDHLRGYGPAPGQERGGHGKRHGAEEHA